MKLTKPIIFFDLETTGTDVSNDRIVEISCMKINPDNTRIVKTMLINPEMPIPKGASDVHGITDDMVADKPTFKQISQSMYQFFHGCDLGGFNSNRFDVPLLHQEFHRVGIHMDLRDVNMLDVQIIFHKKEPRDLTAAYKFYTQKDLEDAHSAEADISATVEIFEAMMEKYELSDDLSEISKEFTYNPNAIDLAGKFILDEEGVPVFNFGKHKGQSVNHILQMDWSYKSWILYKSDFTQESKDRLEDIMDGKYNK